MSTAKKKRICIIYTGGTLGMRPSDAGYVVAGDLRAVLDARIPELADPAMPDYELIEYDPPLESSNIAPEHWYALARAIAEVQSSYDGFVVIHGTDTMAYTASALAFLLGDVTKPVVLTGSQIPLYELRNDARGNLLAAVEVAAFGKMREVCVCFGSRLLRACRTTKVSARAFDAFDSPNAPPLADVGIHIRFRENGTAPAERANPTRLPAFRSSKIIVLPLFPGIGASYVDAALRSGVDGAVLESFGLGNAPDQDRDLLLAIGDAADRGVVIVTISQCLEGGVDVGAYAAGTALARANVISGHDMTREAAVTKLHYLAALDLDNQTMRSLMLTNLRGEMTVDHK